MTNLEEIMSGDPELRRLATCLARRHRLNEEQGTRLAALIAQRLAQAIRNGETIGFTRSHQGGGLAIEPLDLDALVKQVRNDP